VTIEKQNSLAGHPLGALPREDLDIIVELVLRSGSLKDLASAYGVTYPTIRLRLDRVIARLQAVVNGKGPEPLKELLASLVERGELSAGGARSVRDLVQDLMRDSKQENSTQKGGVE
jgi:hypothetical protein